MEIKLNPAAVTGLGEEERAALTELLKVYKKHLPANEIKEKYYEGKIPLRDVNLGIALPKVLKGLEIGCAWGAKTVDVLAARSMFDGFVGVNGEDVPEIDSIVEENRLVPEYMKACRDELKYGGEFATLSMGTDKRARVRFHTVQTAAAIWSGAKGRIACGFAIIDTAPDNESQGWTPSLINLYTDSAIVVLSRDGSKWSAKRYRHKMGRPLMEPLVWNATSDKPFGRSRLKEPVRNLIKSYVRTMANASIGLEFSTSPQKYLLGVTDEQHEALINEKFRNYVGSIISATNNPDTGEKPSFGQLAQGSISPHVEMLRAIATQFSAATGLPVTDTGVINDANPTSSDAIEAQTKTLVGMAEELNRGNAEALKTIALMALAMNKNASLAELTPEERSIMAHFKNPAMPSIAATADAAIKIAGARKAFADTDAFLEMLGFDKADIRRIKAQEQRNRGLAFFEEMGSE